MVFFSFAEDMTMNKRKCLKRTINSSRLSPSHPINQCPTQQDRPCHTNQQRGFKKISLPVPGDHLYISGYLPNGEGGGDQKKVLLPERPLIFLSISFWHLNQTHPAASRFLWELNFWTPAGTGILPWYLKTHVLACMHSMRKPPPPKNIAYTDINTSLFEALEQETIWDWHRQWADLFPSSFWLSTILLVCFYLTISSIVVRHQTGGSWGALERTSDTRCKDGALKMLLRMWGFCLNARLFERTHRCTLIQMLFLCYWQ